jgi:hypothetical protein
VPRAAYAPRCSLQLKQHLVLRQVVPACLALYVEQVDERKLVCVWCMEKLLCSQLVPGTNKQFFGARLDRSARLLEPAKSVTQANHQHVLFVEDVCLLILHCRRLISTAIEYRWIPHNSGFGFLDRPRPALGQIHFLDRF